jgi:hypothetical protein
VYVCAVCSQSFFTVYRNTAPAHQLALCTAKYCAPGVPKGGLYPHRKCQKKICTLLHLHLGYPQLRLYLYRWYGESLTPWVLR